MEAWQHDEDRQEARQQGEDWMEAQQHKEDWQEAQQCEEDLDGRPAKTTKTGWKPGNTKMTGREDSVQRRLAGSLAQRRPDGSPAARKRPAESPEAQRKAGWKPGMERRNLRHDIINQRGHYITVCRSDVKGMSVSRRPPVALNILPHLPKLPRSLEGRCEDISERRCRDIICSVPTCILSCLSLAVQLIHLDAVSCTSVSTCKWTNLG